MKLNDRDGNKVHSAGDAGGFTSADVGGTLSTIGPSEHYALDQIQTADTVVPWQDTSAAWSGSCAPIREEHSHPDDAAVASVKPSHERLIDGH